MASESVSLSTTPSDIQLNTQTQLSQPMTFVSDYESNTSVDFNRSSFTWSSDSDTSLDDHTQSSITDHGQSSGMLSLSSLEQSSERSEHDVLSHYIGACSTEKASAQVRECPGWFVLYHRVPDRLRSLESVPLCLPLSVVQCSGRSSQLHHYTINQHAHLTHNQRSYETFTLSHTDGRQALESMSLTELVHKMKSKRDQTK